MRKLIITLLIAVIAVSAIVCLEYNNLSEGFRNNAKVSIMTNISQKLDSFSDSQILQAANKSSSIHYTKVLNKEISGNIIMVELEGTSESNKYIGSFRLINNNLSLEGTIKSISDKDLLLNNNLEDTGNSSKEDSTSKNNEYVVETVNDYSNSDNFEPISNAREVENYVLKYLKGININISNLQSSVLANQTIDGETGYLVQLYNNVENHDVIKAVVLVTKDGKIYNATTNPLKILN